MTLMINQVFFSFEMRKYASFAEMNVILMIGTKAYCRLTVEICVIHLSSKFIEADARRCSVKKVFLEISQNSQENICASVSSLLKKRLWHRYFPVNFAKFLRTPFLTEHLWWLLLNLVTLLIEKVYSY